MPRLRPEIAYMPAAHGTCITEGVQPNHLPIAGSPTEAVRAPVFEVLSEQELTQRLVSLVSLLSLYALGLVTVAFLSDGPDIGVLLAALFGHAVFTGTRTIWRRIRAGGAQVSAGARGVMVLSQRPQFIPYAAIAHAQASPVGLTLNLRSVAGQPTASILLRWSGKSDESQRFLDRVSLRLAHAAWPARSVPRIPVSAASIPASSRLMGRESLARVAAALGDMSPRSSTQLPASH
jgi:hypothetical protein